MTVLIVSIVLALMFTIFVVGGSVNKLFYSFVDIIKTVISGILVLILSFVMFFSFLSLTAMVFVFSTNTFEVSEEKEQIQIVSLKTNTKTEGKIFLSSGIIEERPYYFYTTKKEEAYSLESIPALDTKIYEDGTQEYSYILKTDKIKKLPEWLVYNAIKNTETTYSIHIPVGNIIQEYKVGE